MNTLLECVRFRRHACRGTEIDTGVGEMPGKAPPADG